MLLSSLVGGSVAQLVEQLPLKEMVLGSIPSRPHHSFSDAFLVYLFLSEAGLNLCV
jgi:hypothetical protein